MRILSFLMLAAAAATSLTAQTQVTPSLSWEVFDYKHAGGTVPAERATLVVPERHGRPEGRTIELAVVRFRTRSDRPGPPTVYLAGGPGASGIEAGRGARFPLFDKLRETGDLILFDQRGAGFSRPNLGCPERWGFDPSMVRTWASLLTVARARVQVCVNSLRQQGVDISAYNTRESADDIERLRLALGATSINLLAISYGTHLGLATMRQHETRLNRAVLAGVVGPGHVLKLPSNMDAVFARFGAEANAHPAFGPQRPFINTVRQLMGVLEKAPPQVTVDRNGQQTTVRLSPFDVRVLLALALEDRPTMRNVPSFVDALAQGDYLPAATQIAGLTQGFVPSIMNLAMECASGGSAARRRQIAAEEGTSLIGRGIDFPQPDICDLLGVEDLGDSFRGPVRSAIPTLLISGEIDLRTPPSNAEEVRAGLSAASHIVIGRAGHDDDLLVSSPELVNAIAAFLGGQSVSDRRIELPPIPFAER